MNRVRLEIIGLSYSQTQSGAYVLLLGERETSRKLPIIIGSYEAQSIAIELEKMIPNRPLTHDLFRTIATSLNIRLVEIVIDKLEEGVFHSKLLFEQNNNQVTIDARTSDAIAIAVRFKCPVYTYETIMDSAGILMDENEKMLEDDLETEESVGKLSVSEGEFSGVSSEQLHDFLNKALEDENYELASKIRDEINKRSSGN